MNIYEQALEVHEKLKWKIQIQSKIEVHTKEDLSLAYTPGVAEPCKKIAENKQDVYKYTMKGNMVAVISDGSAVLGLWDIGPEAALPVMEWKCVLFKKFAGVNAFPIVLNTKDTEEIIKTIKNIAPWFGGINLEDIGAPRCFEIEDRLKEELDIPVMHDDQHGTAIVTLAWIINALKVTGKSKENVKVVVNGVGAAGVATTKLLLKYGIKDIVMVDSVGTIHKWRKDLNPVKEMLTNLTNTACLLDPNSTECVIGGLDAAVQWRDMFIGVSKGNVLTKEMVQGMAPNAIIFAMANPYPEIMPELAYEAGAAVIATWRSDFPNQINNSLVFPGVFLGALRNGVKKITDEMKIQAAINLAAFVKEPTKDKVIPGPFEEGIAEAVAQAIKD